MSTKMYSLATVNYKTVTKVLTFACCQNYTKSLLIILKIQVYIIQCLYYFLEYGIGVYLVYLHWISTVAAAT